MGRQRITIKKAGDIYSYMARPDANQAICARKFKVAYNSVGNVIKKPASYGLDEAGLFANRAVGRPKGNGAGKTTNTKATSIMSVLSGYINTLEKKNAVLEAKLDKVQSLFN